MMPTVASGGGAVVHPVPRPAHATDDDDAATTDDDDAAEECFICAKPVQTSERVAPTTAQGLACECLAHHALHQACFDEWYNKEGTCPLCRSVCAETAAIRLHIRETMATVQQEAEEMIRRKNRWQVVVGALTVCVLLLVLLLLNHNPAYSDDDDWQHTHDDVDRKTAASSHTQGTTPSVWHLSR